MTTFSCTLEQFKQVGKEFDLSLANCTDPDEAEAGWKCVSLHYLGINHAHGASPILAAGHLRYWSNCYIKWQSAHTKRKFGI